jgi:hypothetical protein
MPTHLANQRPQPMPLTLTKTKRRPTVEGKAMSQTGKNGGNRSLKTRPIIPGPKPLCKLWNGIRGGGEYWRTLRLGKRAGRIPAHKASLLLLQVDVCVKEIFEQGKLFPWPRPPDCPRCHGRIWGHGFVGAYFDGFVQVIFLRRYRCPDCPSVKKARCSGWHFWSPIDATAHRSYSDEDHSQ